MTKGNEAGVANQDIQTDRKQCPDGDVGGEESPKAAPDEREERQRCDRNE